MVDFPDEALRSLIFGSLKSPKYNGVGVSPRDVILVSKSGASGMGA